MISSKSANPLGIIILGALCGLVGSCVPLDNKSAFPVAGKPFDASSLQTHADPATQVLPLNVRAAGRQVGAFYARHPHSHGVLIFFGGSGNQLDAAVQVLDPPTKSLGLDLVVFSYYQAGEATPSVADVRLETRAVYRAVAAMHTPATQSIYLLGHSLGGWFALDLAATETGSGLILAGAGTTAKEIIRKNYAPWAELVTIRENEDHRQLDASLYAPRLRVRTLVFTSKEDEAVPVSVSRELFAMIPAATPKRLVVLEGFSHGRYFKSDGLWRQCAEFFGLRREKVDGTR